MKVYQAAVRSLANWLAEQHPDVGPVELDRDHVRGWLAHVRQTRSSSTARAWFPGVRHFARWLQSEGEANQDATTGIRSASAGDRKPRCCRSRSCAPFLGPAPDRISRIGGTARSSCCFWTAGCGCRSSPTSRSPVYFADEARIRSDYHADTTWAAVDQTPVMHRTGIGDSANLISAVTPRGILRFAAVDGTLDAPEFIGFCRKLLSDTVRPVILILDDHPVHRSNAVEEFAASNDRRLRLWFLPPYLLKLNLDEWVWKNIKHDRVSRAAISSSDDVQRKALAAWRRLQKLPHVVRGYFDNPILHYITA